MLKGSLLIWVTSLFSWHSLIITQWLQILAVGVKHYESVVCIVITHFTSFYFMSISLSHHFSWIYFSLANVITSDVTSLSNETCCNNKRTWNKKQHFSLKYIQNKIRCKKINNKNNFKSSKKCWYDTIKYFHRKKNSMLKTIWKKCIFSVH